MATWLQSLGNLNNSLTDKFMAGGIGKGLGSLGITSGSLGGIANTIGNMATGLLAGQNQTGVGNAMQTIGGLASNIPGVGGLIGAGVSVVGGLVNAAFGSHINDEFVNQTNQQANALGSTVFNANTNGDLLNDWQNMTAQSNVSKSEVGSDGWFSNKAQDKTNELNARINEANRRQLANFGIAAENVDRQNDLRILQNMAAYGGPIGSFRKFYAKGGYLEQAKALIRQNEGFRDKPYNDAPKGKNWRSVGYGFNDSGFRDKYPEGISKHYERGITKKQAEEELDYFLRGAEKQLKNIYGSQWSSFTDSQKAAILDTYYQRPASVGKTSRFYKAVTAGEDPSRYLGVAGFTKRNNIRQNVFGGGEFTGVGYSDEYNPNGETGEITYPSSSPLLEATSPYFDLSGVTPTQAINPTLNLPTLDTDFLASFGQLQPTQQAVPTVGTVEDYLQAYDNLDVSIMLGNGGKLHGNTFDSDRLITKDRFDMNMFDFGGGLTHGSEFDTGINWVNEGGSHSENPLGGVPMGVDEEGIPNLVEQDEAIWNGDYVFSKRMKVPKKLRDKYKLPEGATFADAVAKLTKESEERPLDEISRATQDHILGELADSQEELRMAKAQREADKQMQLQDDFLMGFQAGFGGPLFSDGGGIHIDPSKRGTFKAQASKMGMGVQEAASHILANKENYSPAIVKKANFARNSSKWHEDGGSLFANPFEPNTFAEGGSKSKKKASNRGNIVDFAYDWYRNGSNGLGEPTGFRVGNNGRAYGYTEDYRNLVNSLGADDIRRWAAEHPNDPSLRSFLSRGNKLENLTDEQWRKGATDGKYGFMHHVADNMLKDTDDFEPVDIIDLAAQQTGGGEPEAAWNFGDPEVQRQVADGTYKDPFTNQAKDNSFTPRPTWMRQVPIWLSGLAALRGELTPADYSNADAITAAAYQAGQPVSVGTEYIGDYRKRDPFDQHYLETIINQRGAATNRNMMNFSGGNRAVGMAGILANDLVTQQGLAEAARQGYIANRTDDAQVSEFNRGTNLANMQAQNTRNLALAQLNSQRQNAMLSGIAQGARLRQAIKDQRDAAISANWTNFAQNMSDWGKENGFYNMLGGLNEEGVLKYFFGDNYKTRFNNTSNV